MSHDAWIFLDILSIVIGLLVAMNIYASTYEKESDQNDYSGSGTEEPLWRPDHE